METNKSNLLFICLFFSNIAGNKKHLIITAEQLKLALRQGIRIDGSDIVGLTGICDTEFILWPLSETMSKETVENKSYCTYNCRVTTADGNDIKEISEDLMRDVLENAKKIGLTATSNMQLVNFLFPSCKPTILLNAS